MKLLFTTTDPAFASKYAGPAKVFGKWFVNVVAPRSPGAVRILSRGALAKAQRLQDGSDRVIVLQTSVNSLHRTTSPVFAGPSATGQHNFALASLTPDQLKPEYRITSPGGALGGANACQFDFGDISTSFYIDGPPKWGLERTLSFLRSALTNNRRVAARLYLHILTQVAQSYVLDVGKFGITGYACSHPDADGTFWIATGEWAAKTTPSGAQEPANPNVPRLFVFDGFTVSSRDLEYASARPNSFGFVDFTMTTYVDANGEVADFSPPDGGPIRYGQRYRVVEREEEGSFPGNATLDSGAQTGSDFVERPCVISYVPLTMNRFSESERPVSSPFGEAYFGCRNSKVGATEHINPIFRMYRVSSAGALYYEDITPPMVSYSRTGNSTLSSPYSHSGYVDLPVYIFDGDAFVKIGTESLSAWNYPTVQGTYTLRTCLPHTPSDATHPALYHVRTLAYAADHGKLFQRPVEQPASVFYAPAAGSWTAVNDLNAVNTTTTVVGYIDPDIGTVNPGGLVSVSGRHMKRGTKTGTSGVYDAFFVFWTPTAQQGAGGAASAWARNKPIQSLFAAPFAYWARGGDEPGLAVVNVLDSAALLPNFAVSDADKALRILYGMLKEGEPEYEPLSVVLERYKTQIGIVRNDFVPDGMLPLVAFSFHFVFLFLV